MAISAAAFSVTVPNGVTTMPTAYTITSTDVTNGISILPSFFTTAASYGQSGFLPEKLFLYLNTTTAGTSFKAIIKATIATTDVPNSAPPFPLANAGDVTLNINAVGTYPVFGFTSGRFMQPDGSILINFSGTLGVTTLYGFVQPYAPLGPRG
ncbi:MAG: hypothetical protein ACRDRN_10345 [Sciscionella sp.]